MLLLVLENSGGWVPWCIVCYSVCFIISFKNFKKCFKNKMTGPAWGIHLQLYSCLFAQRLLLTLEFLACHFDFLVYFFNNKIFKSSAHEQIWELLPKLRSLKHILKANRNIEVAQRRDTWKKASPAKDDKVYRYRKGERRLLWGLVYRSSYRKETQL